MKCVAVSGYELFSNSTIIRQYTTWGDQKEKNSYQEKIGLLQLINLLNTQMANR